MAVICVPRKFRSTNTNESSCSWYCPTPAGCINSLLKAIQKAQLSLSLSLSLSLPLSGSSPTLFSLPSVSRPATSDLTLSVMVRGKTVLKRIENEANRQVTFSKRRAGMFKKAKELSILCDAQIGVIVFTNTGQLYDFSSSSMKSIIERYRHVKEGQQYVPASTEAKFWQEEAEKLRQQLNNLQQIQSQLLGYHLSGLDWKDLQALERHVKASLANVQLKKEQMLLDQVEKSSKKVTIINNENVELQRKISIATQENEDLMKEIHGLLEVSRENTDYVPQYGTNTQDHVNTASLELCQPHNKEMKSADVPTLELRLN